MRSELWNPPTLEVGHGESSEAEGRIVVWGARREERNKANAAAR